MGKPIEHHSKPGDIVYDPFLGSGTTLMAADDLERICYGMDVEPKWVDTTILRWQSATNETAILDDDGRSYLEVAEQRLDEQRRSEPLQIDIEVNAE